MIHKCGIIRVGTVFRKFVIDAPRFGFDELTPASRRLFSNLTNNYLKLFFSGLSHSKTIKVYEPLFAVILNDCCGGDSNEVY